MKFSKLEKIKFEIMKIDDNIRGYTVIHKLGEGGYGSVWMVEKKGKFWAMKEQDMTGKDEVSILKQFNHKNIIKIIHSFVQNNKTYIIFPLYGKDLHNQKMTPSSVKKLYEDMKKALNHIHEKGYVHNDIKPSNIVTTILPNETKKIITNYCKRNNKIIPIFETQESFVLIDFNFSLEEGSYCLSTQEYASPEMLFDKECNRQSDYWMLGTTLYELLTQEYLFNMEEGDYETQKKLIRKYIGDLVTFDNIVYIGKRENVFYKVTDVTLRKTIFRLLRVDPLERRFI